MREKLRGDEGFMLIEVLVGLTILSIALLASMRAISLAADTQLAVSQRTMALWSADNTFNDIRMKRVWPEIGTNTFTCPQATLLLVCQRKVSPMPNPNFRRVEVTVFLGSLANSTDIHGPRLAWLVTIAPKSQCGSAMKDKATTLSEGGFTLIEVMVALVIISLVGMMAWRGMDAMIRGQENIEGRAKQDAVYMQLVRQFERDCQEIIPGSTLDIPSFSVGEKNIWWVRRYEQANQIRWVIVGYGISSNGLQRLVSQPLVNKTEILGIWQALIRDPDLISGNMKISLEIPEIIYQEANAINNAPSQGSIGTQLAGFTMRWGIKNIPYPISRSCLAETSL